MASNLQDAINSLEIRDVYLTSVNASISDGFEPKYEFSEELVNIQSKHMVVKSSILELTEDTSEKVELFRVHVDLGMRWVSKDDATEYQDNDERTHENEITILAEIEASFVAEYNMLPNPGKEALNIFALNNASFHIWPYWREFLSSQCIRMSLPKIVSPAFQIAQNKEQLGDGKLTSELST